MANARQTLPVGKRLILSGEYISRQDKIFLNELPLSRAARYHVIPVETGIQRANRRDSRLGESPEETRSGSGMTDKGVDH
jgi:hypothetical protein